MQKFNDNFTVNELKDLCRKFDLSVSGLKHELAQRVSDHLYNAHSCGSCRDRCVTSRSSFLSSFAKRFVGPRLNLVGVIRRPTESSPSLWDRIKTNSAEFITGRLFEGICSRFFERIVTLICLCGGFPTFYRLYSIFIERQHFEPVVCERVKHKNVKFQKKKNSTLPKNRFSKMF